MAFVSNQADFEQEVCAALGLGPNKVHRITIDIPAHGIVTATIEMHPDDPLSLATVIKRAKWETINDD